MRGTAFVMRVDSQPYLVTAAHLINKPKEATLLRVRTGWEQWEDINFEPIPLSEKLDIAVSRASGSLIQAYGLQVETLAGKLANFPINLLGFPYAGEVIMNTHTPTKQRTYNLSSNYELDGVSRPVAMVKHGTLAGVDSRDPESLTIFIDAMDNPGFSGGPIIVWNAQEQHCK